MRTDPGAARAPRARWARSVALFAATLLAACSSSAAVSWPGVSFELPPGWEVVEQTSGRLVLADHARTQDERGVLVTFVRAPDTLPDDWRRSVAERQATLETDAPVLIAGDVPATQLILRDVIDGIPLREALLVVPSRGLVIAITPRLLSGEQDGPELLLESLDAVRALLDEVELAPPVLG
jgi:hypothetical protein